MSEMDSAYYYLALQGERRGASSDHSLTDMAVAAGIAGAARELNAMYDTLASNAIPKARSHPTAASAKKSKDRK